MNRHAPPHARPRDDVLTVPALDAGLGEMLFGALPRAEQRRKAGWYVRGLLAQPGRKTLRNIARQFGGDAAQQSVHHFISASPWDWMPVRHALAEHVHRTLAPEAWVIRPTVIPKAGPHSIGADPQGPGLYGQQAVGVWLAGSRYAVPIDWRLRLSGRWLEEPLRQRAGIPPGAASGTLEEFLGEAVTGLRRFAGMPDGPAVVDAEGIDGAALAARLAHGDGTFLVRIDVGTPLHLNRAKLPRFGDRDRTAAELAAALPRLRRRVDAAGGPTTVVAIPVAQPRARGKGLLLVGEWRNGPVGSGLWLTNADPAESSTLLRLMRLPAVVTRDFADVSVQVGVTDFAGRSFPGWHRHITLASVAHQVAAASRAYGGDVE
ncbi:IS701 family transposase [Streptomyces sp. NPDC058579]|uniref:IS701 family transposase n=1 Tax=Streptomyces sp. NPDC058579 TaxID=3346548 RepID=UPI0036488F57